MPVALAGYPLRKPSSGERCTGNFQAVSISGMLNAIARAAGQCNRQHQDSQNAHVLISRPGDIKAEANAADNSESPEIANRLLVNLGKSELASYYRPIPPARWLVIGVV